MNTCEELIEKLSTIQRWRPIVVHGHMDNLVAMTPTDNGAYVQYDEVMEMLSATVET